MRKGISWHSPESWQTSKSDRIRWIRSPGKSSSCAIEGAVMNVVASVRKAAAPAAMIGALLAAALHAPAFAGPASKAPSVPVQCSDEAACIDLANGSVTREPGLLTFRPKLGPVVAFRDAAPDCSMVLDPEDGDPSSVRDYACRPTCPQQTSGSSKRRTKAQSCFPATAAPSSPTVSMSRLSRQTEVGSPCSGA